MAGFCLWLSQKLNDLGNINVFLVTESLGAINLLRILGGRVRFDCGGIREPLAPVSLHAEEAGPLCSGMRYPVPKAVEQANKPSRNIEDLRKGRWNRGQQAQYDSFYPGRFFIVSVPVDLRPISNVSNHNSRRDGDRHQQSHGGKIASVQHHIHYQSHKGDSWVQSEELAESAR
jgi:hypothetical protein